MNEEDELKIRLTSRSPSKDPVYSRTYNRFYKDLSKRKNFKKAHLEKLYKCCSLNVLADRLDKILREDGIMKKGEIRPEFTAWLKLLSEIRQIEKELKIRPEDDDELSLQKKKEEKKKDEWNG